MIAQPRSQVRKRGFTLVEIVVGVIFLLVVRVTWQAVASGYGTGMGVAAASLSALACAAAIVAFYWAADRLSERKDREFREKYPSVYRVLAAPDEKAPVLKAEGVDIDVGDNGWEAEPIHTDGLVYLHGLSRTWHVVWYAGFRPDQIELIGPKPRSQYDLPYAWRGANAMAHPCPFPVQRHVAPSKTLGLPTTIIGTYVQGKQLTK